MTAKSIVNFSLIPAELGRIPGNRGMWVGIYCEMTEFALMFIVYFMARVHFPEIFRQGPTQLATIAGTANTIFMLTSSYFVVRAVRSTRQGNSKQCVVWLAATLIMALSYIVVKYFEYRWYSNQGIKIHSNAFFTVYYYLTLNHLVHVFWGSLGILWVIGRSWFGVYTPENYNGLEAFASYWHTIDLAWLIIFPLLYVLR